MKRELQSFRTRKAKRTYSLIRFWRRCALFAIPLIFLGIVVKLNTLHEFSPESNLHHWLAGFSSSDATPIYYGHQHPSDNNQIMATSMFFRSNAEVTTHTADPYALTRPPRISDAHLKEISSPQSPTKRLESDPRTSKAETAPTGQMDGQEFLEAESVSNAEWWSGNSSSSLRSHCSHTLEGPLLVADSNGYVCPRTMIGSDPRLRGCCPARRVVGAPFKNLRGAQNDAHDVTVVGTSSSSATDGDDPEEKRFTCRSCDMEEQCCGVYEYCVACCLNPDNLRIVGALRLGSSHVVYRHPGTTPMGFCELRCRHSSQSVVNMNSYRSPHHHCFGTMRPPLVSGASVNSDQSTFQASKKAERTVFEPEEVLLDMYLKGEGRNQSKPLAQFRHRGDLEAGEGGGRH